MSSLTSANRDGNDNYQQEKNENRGAHESENVDSAFVQKVVGDYGGVATLVSEILKAIFEVVTLESIDWPPAKVLRLKAGRHVLPSHLMTS